MDVLMRAVASKLPWLKDFLGTVANAENVDDVALDLEKDAEDPSPLAVKHLSNLARIPLAFGSKPAPLRVDL